MSSLSLRTSIATALLLVGLGSCMARAAMAAPSVVSIDPNNGAAAGGTSVTIEGSGFVAGATVAFGATPSSSVRVLSPSTIVATSPAGSGLVGVRVSDGTGLSAAAPVDQFAYDPLPSAHWLGLNGNGDTELGPIDRFERAGIVYDRSGQIDWIAGELPERDGRPTPGGTALSRDYGAGMTPVVTIEYGGYEGEYEPDPHFPGVRGGSESLERYVEGFVASAKAILRAHPHKQVLFEAMNEPWGYTTPQFDGARYAAVIARLLPAARRAGIPLQDVYVAATGRRWISEMYRASPQLQTEVEGWYLHPYGPPNGVAGEGSEGIQSLPQLQAQMTSGQNNLIVSELGYCARNVNGGRGCGSPSTATGEEAARDLTEALENAVPYHRAGWLRALLVYSRSAGGWAMQFPNGRLTAQGRALLAFQARLPSFAYTSGFGGLGVRLPAYFAG
jgi:hypothetical protein